MWADGSVFYQIYPLGLCGAPRENDGVSASRISRIEEWIPHLKGLYVNAVYFSPLFESDRHGYDTRDFRKTDCRLGTNEEVARLFRKMKSEGIRVVLDAVFHHVGRGFWAFQDVIRQKWDSEYKDWFYIDFARDTEYHDGFHYEPWEGHYELVKLNLGNEQVVSYLLESVKFWIETFDIDGLRLDVAYSLSEQFMRRLRSCCDGIKSDFFLVGEVLFGDYNRIVNEEMLHSCTNYECYKGLYSSFNDMNMFEIAHSLNRQFGSEPHCLYRGKNLLSFADNHDVSRLASILKNKNHLPLVYALLFAMPGIPCIYYGSEWGALGDKKDGDDSLRPAYSAPEVNELSRMISELSRIRGSQEALHYGSYRHIYLTNRQLAIERELNGRSVVAVINADEAEAHISLNTGVGEAEDLLNSQLISLSEGLRMPGYSFRYLLINRN